MENDGDKKQPDTNTNNIVKQDVTTGEDQGRYRIHFLIGTAFLRGLGGLASGLLTNFIYDLLKGRALSINASTSNILVMILLAVICVIVGIPKVYSWLKRRIWYWALPLSVAMFVFMIRIFSSQSCPDCPCHGASDTDVIIKTIKAESAAVVSKDLVLIQKIFSEDAIIIDASSGKIWKRDDRYSTLFENADFLKVEQFEFQPVSGISQDEDVVYTTGSIIEFKKNYVEDSNRVYRYVNKPGSSEWTLRKNDCGCWVIVKLRFNIST
jgi:ketosteroid isomerase-like protein